MTKTKNLLLLSAVIALSGCGTMSKTASYLNPFSGSSSDEAPALVASSAQECPRVAVVEDLNNSTKFQDGNNTPSYIMASAQLSSIKSQCALHENNVILDMDIMLRGQLGPRGRVLPTDIANITFPYFVAITTPQGEIIAKELFNVSVPFEPQINTTEVEDKLRQVIPLTGDFAAKQFEVLVGFQLTPDELKYNRDMAAQGLAPTPTIIHNVNDMNNVAAVERAPTMDAHPVTIVEQQDITVSAPEVELDVVNQTASVPRAPDAAISADQGVSFAPVNTSDTLAPISAPVTSNEVAVTAPVVTTAEPVAPSDDVLDAMNASMQNASESVMQDNDMAPISAAISSHDDQDIIINNHQTVSGRAPSAPPVVTAVEPLYPVKTGTAPPPPVAGKPVRVIPRMDY
jgi:hypothetical protein